MALDKLGICNEALSEIPADAIGSFEENSPAAEWCARLYPSALVDLLALGDFKFPRKRQTLATIANDRAGEWQYAYQIPTDCAAELRVYSFADLNPQIPPVLAGFIVGPTMAFLVPAQWRAYAFLVAGTVIYTNVADAVLEYISESPDEQAFPPLVRRALATELASRLVMPILKDRTRQGDLIKMAEVARERAITASVASDPSESTYGNFEPEISLARGGFGYVGQPWWGWDVR
jgi:hypothetical protein